jgi:hypothetical protein
LIDEKIEKLSNQKPENLAAVNDGSIQYVPDDIGNINVDEIVDKLGHVEGMYNLRCISVSTLQRFRFDFHTTNAQSTNQMCLIHSINQLDMY